MMLRNLFYLEAETTQPERDLREKREEKVSPEFSYKNLILEINYLWEQKSLVHEAALLITLTNF